MFANEYTANVISGFRTVLIVKVEGEGVGNQPFGKLFNDADGHAEANFLEALRGNDWVFDAGYQESVVSLNNSPCRQCCVLFRQFMEDILLRFPNTRLVIEREYLPPQRRNRPRLPACDFTLARHSRRNVQRRTGGRPEQRSAG